MPPFIHVNPDRHGTVRYYVRRGGRYLGRIHAEPGTDEFLRQYAAILSGALAPAPKPVTGTDTFQALCQEYLATGVYKALATGTRANQRRLLGNLCDDVGGYPFKAMQRVHVLQMMDAHADRPHAANNRLKALRALFKWAVRAGRVDADPTTGVEKLSGRNPDGHHTWTEDEVAAYEARHPTGTMARLALDLLLFTGVRRSDAVGLGRAIERNGVLRFVEAKGRDRRPKKRAIPILPVLQASIDACPSGHLTYLVSGHGRPFSAASFGMWFRKRCDEAGLTNCSAHGLRKVGATRCAEAGATDRQLMAIFGWTNAAQASVYTRQANADQMVADAIHLIGTPRRSGVPKS